MENQDQLREKNGKVMELKNTISGKEEVKQRLPNGGWGWIVVFGSFICNAVLGKCASKIPDWFGFTVFFFQMELLMPTA